MPSFVICSDEVTTGGDPDDRTNRIIAANAATATMPVASHVVVRAFGRGLTTVADVLKKERILSLESGASLALDPAGKAWLDSVVWRRVWRSARISAALA